MHRLILSILRSGTSRHQRIIGAIVECKLVPYQHSSSPSEHQVGKHSIYYKLDYSIMNSSSIFTALSVLAAFSTAAAVEPFITTSLRFFSDSKTCDCQFPDKSKVVEEIVTGRCIPTSGKIQSLAVNITGDWNGMLSIEFL